MRIYIIVLMVVALKMKRCRPFRSFYSVGPKAFVCEQSKYVAHGTPTSYVLQFPDNRIIFCYRVRLRTVRLVSIDADSEFSSWSSHGRHASRSSRVATSSPRAMLSRRHLRSLILPPSTKRSSRTSSPRDGYHVRSFIPSSTRLTRLRVLVMVMVMLG